MVIASLDNNIFVQIGLVPNSRFLTGVVELTPHGEDVLLVVMHRRLDGREAMVSVASGWHTHLEILNDLLQGREPRPFWSSHAVLEAEYERRIPAP